MVGSPAPRPVVRALTGVLGVSAVIALSWVAAPVAASSATSVDDICAQVARLTADGAPREALELVDALRAGSPQPTPEPTRRTLIPATPTPILTPDCESERLAALSGLADALTPTPSTSPDEDEATGSSTGTAGVLPAVLLALLLVAGVAGLVALLSRRAGRSAAAPTAGSRRVELAVTDQNGGHVLPADSAVVLDRVETLVRAGYARGVPLSLAEDGTLLVDGAYLTVAPEVPVEAAEEQYSRFEPAADVRIVRGSDGSVVRVRVRGRDGTAQLVADLGALDEALFDAGFTSSRDDLERLRTDHEAAAAIALLAALDGEPASPERVLSVVLQRLAGHAPTPAALREVALQLDPSDLRLRALVDGGPLVQPTDPAGLREELAAARAALDDILETGSQAEPRRPPLGWDDFAISLLTRVLGVALDLRALTGVPTDVRTDSDARLLHDLLTGTGSRGTTGRDEATTGRMLAAVDYCDLFPDERGTGSRVALWADAAVDSDDPDVAFAVAKSFSSSWRDDMAGYLKRDIEVRIADRLRHALPEGRLRSRAFDDPVLRRHATHPWYRALVAEFEPPGADPLGDDEG